jgi:hypothetical protein
VQLLKLNCAPPATLSACQTQDIPYDRMWQDDIHWYPLFLEGASFQGLFAFTNTHTLLWHRLEAVEDMQAVTPAQELCRV